jgi:hypothetical protein
VTGVLNTRYFYSATLGFSVLAALALRRLPYANALAIALVASMALGSAARGMSHADQSDTRLELLGRAMESLPIVVAEGSDFFELMESAPPEVRRRLVYADMPAATPNPDPEPQKMVDAWKPFRPELRVLRIEEVLTRHRRFYLLCTGGGREAVTDWIAQHANTRALARSGNAWLFEVGGSPQATDATAPSSPRP